MVSDKIDFASEWFESVNQGNFDKHIFCSIPSFFEMTRALAYSIVFHQHPSAIDSFVDIGASEGTLCAAVRYGSENRIKVYAIEPNTAMISRIEAQPVEIKALQTALSNQEGSIYFEDESMEVPIYEFDLNPTSYVEVMTFQFLGAEREYYIRKIARDLPEFGIFLSCEKFSHNNIQIYHQNEQKKDAYKAQFFDKETLEKKIKDVLESPDGGMHENMVTPQQYVEILMANFDYVGQFWDAGNFKGFVASNHLDAITSFLEHIPNLNTDFSTIQTPFLIE